MIQNSINQMLGTMAVLKKVGEFQKGQQEQTDILKQMKTTPGQISEQNIQKATGFTKEELAKGAEQQGIKPATPEEQASLNKQMEEMKTKDPTMFDNSPMNEDDTMSLLDKYAEAQEELSKKDAAVAKAEARWKKEAQDKVNQVQKYQEHIDSLKNRMQYYAAANIRDDRGFYANRAVRKDIQKFLAEDEKKYGGTK